MKSKLLLILIILLTACTTTGSSDNALEAAGVIEATEIVVAPEMAGRVAEVFVSKGDHVETGDPLFRIADDLLDAQHRQAAAALETAQANVAAAETAVISAQAAEAPAEAVIVMAQAGVETSAAAVTAAHAQLEAAHAGVAIADNAYQMTLAGVRQVEQPTRVAAWSQDQPDGFETPPWYFDKDEAITAASAEVTAAAEALATEQDNFDAILNDPRYEDLHAAETRLVEAQAAFRVAQQLRDREIARNDDEQIDTYIQNLFDAAEAELNAAQLDYDQQLTSQTAVDLLEARGRLAAATERYELAQDNYNALLTGRDSLEVQAAAAALAQAETAVTAAEAGVTVAEAQMMQAEAAVAQAEAAAAQVADGVAQAQAMVTLAEKQVAEAQAALHVIELQREKLVVETAVAGTIMTRNVQPGELVQPGLTAMTLAQLEDLTVTVYLPENRYGQVSLGDTATLTADSFPDQNFEAVVIRIADQAEYTPRNVQTQEERQTTVYAVELSVRNPEGQLKPGMPADVVFSE